MDANSNFGATIVLERDIYISHIVSMLRRSHHQGQHETILKDHLSRRFWGTAGAYLHQTYLLAFVEQVRAQDLLDGAKE